VVLIEMVEITMRRNQHDAVVIAIGGKDFAKVASSKS
jgi:hypothetical protein